VQNPYLTPARIKAALRALDVRPTRGMGQNFLLDPDALQTIVEAASVEPHDLVIEVGPGLGVLTWELVRRAGAVLAVELDKRLCARLHEEFVDAHNLTIVQGDILRLPPAELLAQRPLTNAADRANPRTYKVVANLPYAITSSVLRHFLQADQRPSVLVVLVQWEVAERIAARPGDMSVLAHSVQAYAEPEIVARVPADSFYPAPAVDSAVLRLRRREQPPANVEDVEAVMRVIKAGFLHARKMLANALPGGLTAMGRRVERDTVLAALERANIDAQRRAETLSFAEWVRVYQELERLS
jgi:16S rRNA (adenine1518-N6/adenine1519-N6)-dimethyltransferase